MFYYTLTATQGVRISARQVGLFLVTVPLVVLLVHTFCFFQFEDLHLAHQHFELSGFTGLYLKTFAGLINVFNITFLIRTWRLIWLHRINLDEKVYHAESKEITWFYVFIGGFIFNYLIFMVSLGIGIIYKENYSVNAVQSTAVLGHLFSMFYYLINQPRVTAIGEKPYAKYAKQNLPAETSQQYLKELEQLMQHEKPFLSDEITLAQLAETMSIPAHHLSMVMNKELKMNFYQFINHYRVEEAKRLLQAAPSDLPVLRIGFQAGFQSKATFNTIFKKLTGETPTQFRSRQGGEPATRAG